MTSLQEIYKCSVCGNIVEVLHTGKGKLVCCNRPMELMSENTVDASKEKHLPVVEEQDGKPKVKVGSTAHPMGEKHYIEWIQIISGEEVQRRFLNPTDEPAAEFRRSGKRARVLPGPPYSKKGPGLFAGGTGKGNLC